MVRHIGQIVEIRTPFLARHGVWTKKTSENGLFPGRLVFYTSLGIYRRFRPKVLFQTAKMPFWARRLNPKVLVMGWKRS